MFPTNFIITNKFDVILVGFGYLNITFDNCDISEKNYGFYYPKYYLSKFIMDNYSHICLYFSQKLFKERFYFPHFINEKNKIEPKFFKIRIN